MQLAKELIYTNKNCVGCNKCINVCSALGACISTESDGQTKARINVDPNRYVACGACFDACEHGAREYADDTEDFFAALAAGEPVIGPGVFIPIAEKNGWIWMIGRITTELVIRQLAEWRKEGHTLYPVSINYSSNQLSDSGYVDFLEETLKKYGMEPEYVEIEITEGVLLAQTAQAEELFRRLEHLGIRLVHDLNKEMIIEGVEENWQYQRLKDFGADTIQGYYFSKPLPAEEAIRFSPSAGKEPAKRERRPEYRR